MKLPLEDDVRLRHMLDAASKIVAFMHGRSRDDLSSDDLLAFGVVRALEIIGEAATHGSQVMRDQHPEIGWQRIADTRNRLIHGYYDIDPDIVWSIVENNIPVLITQLKAILESQSPDSV